jgi:dynein heavy chain
VEKCRNNLHVVLAMSPVGETLRTRCRNFPGLVNNTVIDWFEPWPEQALTSVATVFLAEEALPDALRPQIVEHMVLVHQSVRNFSTQFLVRPGARPSSAPPLGSGALQLLCSRADGRCCGQLCRL